MAVRRGGARRPGLVVDFAGAADRLRGMKARVERRLGRELTHAASGYPPGVAPVEVRATAHVVQAAGMECSGLLDEPTAANNVLQLRDGAIVDVGGGTTGIAVLQDGQVTYTADEPTGGTHFSLVIAGSQKISFEEAEALKITLSEQPRLLPLVRPVMEKVASIIVRHTRATTGGIGHHGRRRFGLLRHGRSRPGLLRDPHPGGQQPDLCDPAGIGAARRGSITCW